MLEEQPQHREEDCLLKIMRIRMRSLSVALIFFFQGLSFSQPPLILPSVIFLSTASIQEYH
jgi:hypothetical protein